MLAMLATGAQQGGTITMYTHYCKHTITVHHTLLIIHHFFSSELAHKPVKLKHCRALGSSILEIRSTDFSFINADSLLTEVPPSDVILPEEEGGRSREKEGEGGRRREREGEGGRRREKEGEG